MIVLAALPLATLVATTMVVYAKAGRVDARADVRTSMLVAAVVVGAALVFVSEVLSTLSLFRPGPILACWIAAAVATGALAVRARVDLRRPASRALKLAPTDAALLAAIVGIVVVTGLVAAAAPPNNGDSMAYHLPRQLAWLDQGSLRHFPTSVLRQLTMPPFAEIAGAHLMALTGGDRANNLVQWGALVLSLVGASRLCAVLGGDRRAQLTAALFVATIPMAALQASNTKNDLVLSALLVAVALFTTELVLDRPPPFGRRWPLVLGAAFGLLVLTKGTGLLFGLPFGLVLAGTLVRRQGPRGAAGPALVVVVALAVCAGHFARNLGAFGSIEGPDAPTHGGFGVVAELVSPASIASNILRLGAQHVALPSDAWNARVTDAVVDVHDAMGLHVNDPRTTYGHAEFGGPVWGAPNEDYTPAPLHVLAMLLATAGAFVERRRLAHPRATALLVLAVWGGALLFFALLRFQLWHARLVLPLEVVASSFVALVLCASRLARALPITALALVAFVAPCLDAWQRPLTGPGSVFVADALAVRCTGNPPLAASVRRIVDAIAARGAADVGLWTGWTTETYVVEIVARDELATPPRFFAVEPDFRPDRPRPKPPEMILTHRRAATPALDAEGARYHLLADDPPFALYERAVAP